jgi:hypothetical protein
VILGLQQDRHPTDFDSNPVARIHS